MKSAVLQPKVRKVRMLAARAADAQSNAKRTRVQARIARLAFKKAKKVFKQAKRTARDAFQEAKLAQRTLKVMCAKLPKGSLPAVLSVKSRSQPEILRGAPVGLSVASARSASRAASARRSPRKQAATTDGWNVDPSRDLRARGSAQASGVSEGSAGLASI
jgi:hypothetical protein